MKKSVILSNGKNKSLFNPEKVAQAASPLKSNYIKNEEKLSNDWGVLKMYHWQKLLDRAFSNRIPWRNAFPNVLTFGWKRCKNFYR